MMNRVKRRNQEEVDKLTEKQQLARFEYNFRKSISDWKLRTQIEAV